MQEAIHIDVSLLLFLLPSPLKINKENFEKERKKSTIIGFEKASYRIQLWSQGFQRARVEVRTATSWLLKGF